jgi:PKD repeat protein
LEAASFYLTVTDTNGCSIDTGITITSPSQIKILLDFTDEQCANACDGTISSFVSGGTSGDGTYSYQWSTGATEKDLTNLCPNTYAVTVHDDNNCPAEDSVTINGPEPLAIHLVEKKDATCGDNNGKITIALSGGSGTPSVSWNNGNSTVNNDHLAAGNYCVTVTDTNHCEIDTCMSISNSEAPAIDTIITYNVSCHGKQDGALKLYIDSTGSSALPYSISWNTGDTLDTISNLAAANYSVTVTDSNHCVAIGNTIITEPDAFVLLADSNDATCNGTCNGTASVSVSGGTTPYTYHWDNGDTISHTDSLCAGIHSVTITDKNGCTAQRNISIEEPAPIIITLEALKNKSCYNVNDGSITISASGGSAPYYYSWPGVGETSPSIGGLDTGTYLVVVSGQNDTACKVDSSFSISGPQAIVVVTSSFPVTCNQDNGVAYIDSIIGGTPPYSWQWSPCSSQCDNDTLADIAEGIYQLQVTDSNHCTITIQDTVSHIDVVKIDSIETTDVLCYGSDDGTATVFSNNIAGPPYTYTWQMSTGDTSSSSDSIKTNLIASHDYIVTITDTNGCKDSKRFGIDEPNELYVQLDGPSSPICIGQSTALSASGSGGTPPYTYVWQHDTTLHSQLITVSPATTTTYRVQAKDANGCMSPIASITVIVYPPLSVVIANPDTICEGEQATLTAVAQGGNGGPYSYVWDNNSTTNPTTVVPLQTTSYSVTIQDQCGTPPTADTTNVIVYPLPRLLVIDNASGCEPLDVTFNPSVYAIDGTPSYEWFFYDQIGSGGASTDSVPTHTYLNSGIYDVDLTLTSVHGCKNDTTISNLVSVYPLPNASFTMDPQSAGVFDAEIQFFDNSEPDITRWYWSFGDTAYSMIQNPIHTYRNAGTFLVNLIVSTSHSCYDTASVYIRIKPEHTFYAPTAFSPGTGYSNNYWYPKGIGIDGKEYHFWIYDRWGQVIYDTEVMPSGTEKVIEEKGGWNGRYKNTGKVVPPDTYVWLVKLHDINGEAHEYSGTVTVVK